MVTALKPTWRTTIFKEDIQDKTNIMFKDITNKNIGPIDQNVTTNLKKNLRTIQENRKTFLQNLQHVNNQNFEVEEHRKKRKISFKVKNNSVLHKRINSNTTTLSINKVQQLTDKFNELIQEQPYIAKNIKRINSIKTDKNKPIIRPKPNKVEDKKLRKKPSIKKIKPNLENSTRSLMNFPRKSVQETIQIFEGKTNIEKPKLPEKNVTKTKELIIKDGVKKLRILKTEKSKNLSDLQNYFEQKCIDKLNKNDDSIDSQSEHDLIAIERQSENDSKIIVTPSETDMKKTDDSHLNEQFITATKEIVVENVPICIDTPNLSDINNKTNENIHEQITQTDIKRVLKNNNKKLYDTLKITKTTPSSNLLKIASEKNDIQPNNSFLYRTKSKTNFNIYASIDYEDNIIDKKHLYEDTGQIDQKSIDSDLQNLYDTVDPQTIDEEEKKYQELLEKTDNILKNYKINNENFDALSNHSYESFYQENDYEIPQKHDDIYETLSLKALEDDNLPKIVATQSIDADEEIYATVKDPYEKIFTNKNDFEYLGSLPQILGNLASNRNSIVSSDQQSNSLYGKYGLENSSSSSDRSLSDDWVDLSDFEEDNTGFVIIRERQKVSKKNSGWSHKVRDQWSKSPKKPVLSSQDDALSDSYHFYESLNSEDDDFDSFDSESDDESHFKANPNDSGVDMGLNQLPDLPRNENIQGGNIYGLTRLAARLRKNWSLTKNDITKSLSRMTKKRDSSETRRDSCQPNASGPLRPPPPLPVRDRAVSSPILQTIGKERLDKYENINFGENKEIKNVDETKSGTKSSASNSLGRKKNWLKFRRAVSMGEPSTEESPVLQVFNPNVAVHKSTFYLPNDTGQDLVGERPQVPARKRPVRPLSPPPPAPTMASSTQPAQLVQVKSAKEKTRSTSWYAEVGLFKNSDNQSVILETQPSTLPPLKLSNTCWYAEVGLYQKKDQQKTYSSSTSSGDVSGSNSRENSGNSTNNLRRKTVPPDLIPNSIFYTNQNDLDDYYNVKNNKKSDKMATLLKDEPLYQFYDAAVQDNCFNDTSSDSDYDGYEQIENLIDNNEKIIEKSEEKITRTSFKKIQNNYRTLWCELPEIKQSQILATLTTTQKKLQEAKFEILTSEASYLNSLNILTNHFIPELTKNDLLEENDQKILFGNIFRVKNCSELFLNDLENCWQESILLSNICDIVRKHSKENFQCYIDYCANQSLSDVILRKYKGEVGNISPKNGKGGTINQFSEVLRRLEAGTICQGLTLHSFLMLPMQRVTRLPLLLDAVLKRLTINDEGFPSCKDALKSVQDLAIRCNEAARQTERLSELKRLQGQLEYPHGVIGVNLLEEGSKRFLVKSGELVQLLAKGGIKSEEQGMKLTFGKRFNKQLITIMLFEDWIVIARKKSEESYTVLHHCPRSFLELSPPDQQPPTIDNSLLIFLTLLENQSGRQVSLLLSCNSESERARWLEALSPKLAEDPNETIYESWDCPQVQAIHNYESIQPDELSLKRGDVVNIDKKMRDGWYHGQNLQNNLSGWFPGNHTIEIANPHVRARNLRQRYRLLAFTDEFLNQNKT